MRWSELSERALVSPLVHMMDADRAMLAFEQDTLPGWWKHYVPSLKRVVIGSCFSRKNNGTFYLRSVRLEIDRDKLRHQHRILPLDGEVVFRSNEHQSKEDEKWKINFADRIINRHSNQLTEEFVVGDVPYLHRYASKVTLYRNGCGSQEALDLLAMATRYCSDYDIELEITESFQELVDHALEMRMFDEKNQ